MTAPDARNPLTVTDAEDGEKGPGSASDRLVARYVGKRRSIGVSNSPLAPSGPAISVATPSAAGTSTAGMSCTCVNRHGSDADQGPMVTRPRTAKATSSRQSWAVQAGSTFHLSCSSAVFNDGAFSRRSSSAPRAQLSKQPGRHRPPELRGYLTEGEHPGCGEVHRSAADVRVDGGADESPVRVVAVHNLHGAVRGTGEERGSQCSSHPVVDAAAEDCRGPNRHPLGAGRGDQLFGAEPCPARTSTPVAADHFPTAARRLCRCHRRGPTRRRRCDGSRCEPAASSTLTVPPILTSWSPG